MYPSQLIHKNFKELIFEISVLVGGHNRRSRRCVLLYQVLDLRIVDIVYGRQHAVRRAPRLRQGTGSHGSHSWTERRARVSPYFIEGQLVAVTRAENDVDGS
jgi:hypothetical protein